MIMEHQHKYIPIISEEQFLERETKRVGGAEYEIVPLKRQIVKIFCEKCGDTKAV
jgi:hypothetical protein